LVSPASDKVRPTADRARESVFNILNSYIDDWSKVRLLDVFCGTGAFGLEGVSRGAAEVCLIDVDTLTAEKNAKLFEAEIGKIKIVRADVSRLSNIDTFLTSPHQLSKADKSASKLTSPENRRGFNIVFLDAPYNKGLSEVALQSLINGGWAADDAIIVVEVEKNETLDASSLELVDQRIYGLAKFLFFRVK